MADAEPPLPNTIQPTEADKPPTPPPLSLTNTNTPPQGTKRTHHCGRNADINCTPHKPQKNKKRCFHPECRKKVSIIGECKCGYIFCAQHRLPEMHHCHFNHRDHDRQYLEQTVVGGGVFQKIEKV